MIFKPVHYLWHGFGTLFLSALACILFTLISYNSAFMDPISQAIGGFSFIDSYFYIENKNANESVDFNDDILLFDIAGCNSRAAIAGKIDEITKLGPKVIGMDVIYGDNSTTSQADNDSLVRVVSRCPQLVTALRIVESNGQTDVEHSFYTKLTQVDEASINVEDGVVRDFVRELNIGGVKKQSFVDRIVQKADSAAYARLTARGNNEERINFKALEFMQLGMNEELFPEDVAGKIVLIGDFQDLRDFHNVPTTIGASQRIAGTKIHAYAISTLLHPERTLDKMSDCGGWIFGLTLSYFFSIIACLCFVEIDKLGGVSTNLVMVLMLAVLSMMGGLIFINFNYELDMTVAMLGIGLAGNTSEMWFWLCTTKPYQWVRKKLHLPDGGVRYFVNNEGNRE